MKIESLRESDRAGWEILARAADTYFETKRPDDEYERTWQRLLKGGEHRGVGAWLDGRMVGIAHYVFHPSIWDDGRTYLADLYVDTEVRRQGVATAVIRWVARDGVRQGFPHLYWNTMEDVPARAMYDKIARHIKGFVTYVYRPDAT